MPSKNSNNQPNAKSWTPVLVAIVGSLFGGGSGTYLYLHRGDTISKIQSVARPDPFTGEEGQNLSNRLITLEERLAAIRLELSRLNAHILRNRDYIDKWTEKHDEEFPPAWLIEDVKALEQKIHTLENVHRERR